FLENKKFVVSKTLKYFEEALADYPFARIHKSYLVNVNEVIKYRKGKGGSVIVSNGKELLVSASKKKQLLSYFE
ncbi:LytR/AlgR family response regulator transcription factor, partial [Eudoraea sp.]